MSTTPVRDLPPGGEVTITMNLPWAIQSEPSGVEVEIVDAPIAVIKASQDLMLGEHLRVAMPVGGGSVTFRLMTGR